MNDLLFAAKSNNEGLWECVPQHLLDTANVMNFLCDPIDGWVSPSFIDATRIEIAKWKKICVFLAAIHDIAKLTPVFQNKISISLPGLTDRLLFYGYDINTEYEENSFYHSYISGAILHECYGINSTICEVIAAHHGIPRGNGRDYAWSRPFKHHNENILGKKNEFKEVWDLALNTAEQLSGIKCSELPEISYAGQILLSGLLITADWISSNECYFPLTTTWDTSLLTDTERGKRGFIASGVRRGWFPALYGYDDTFFTEKFTFDPNCLQSQAGNAAGAGAKLLIIEGPMGVGKTEAALMCAEIMATQSGSGGIYIGLPTQATSNGLFSRFISWASKVSEGNTTVNLVHGGASFNEEFKALQVNTNDESIGTLTVNKWMSGRYRKLMADFVDGTIDQILTMSLDKKFFMLLHEQLAGKVVVLDEVHSYDAYTNEYLETTLAYLGYYHCPVVLLSATLTDELKKDFISAYLQHVEYTIPEKVNYPCISWWDGKSLYFDEVSYDDLKKKDINIQWIQLQEITGKIQEVLLSGGCAGVIRNTVKNAVKTYHILKQALPGYRVILVHSIFLMDDRNRLEEQIIKSVGKKSTIEDRNKLIVVGTQVLEQSLDLDFDIIFTDLCPIDLLLQRLGREHRHMRIRPTPLVEEKAYLIDDGNKDVGKNNRPYNNYILNRTRALIPYEGRVLHIPSEIKTLVETVYDKSAAETDIEGRVYLEQIQKMKSMSKQMRITDPWNSRTIRGMAQRLSGAGTQYNVDSTGVRQGEDSITVLLLKIQKEDITDLAETVRCKRGCIPDEYTREVFLRQIIRIPYYMISQDELDRMKSQTGFGDESVWAYKDILLLDENCTFIHKAHDQDKRYCYHPETGLMEEENERGYI